jgi:hypothetical protein
MHADRAGDAHAERMPSKSLRVMPFREWKALHLQRLDASGVALDVLRLSAVAYALFWNTEVKGMPAPRGMWGHFGAYTAVVLLPTVTFVCARRAYLRWRGVLWSGSVMISGLLGVGMVWRHLDEEEWCEFGGRMMRHPLLFAVQRHLLQPTLQSLHPLEQALASVGQALNTHVAFGIARQPVSPAAAVAAALWSVALAAALEVRLRRQWRRAVHGS